mgnify:CR=1 FL=1
MIYEHFLDDDGQVDGGSGSKDGYIGMYYLRKGIWFRGQRSKNMDDKNGIGEVSRRLL